MTTLYGLKNCDTCKKATKWLDRFGVAYTFVDYREQKPEPETLVAWAEQAGGFDALINKSSTTWRQLPDNKKDAWLAGRMEAAAARVSAADPTAPGRHRRRRVEPRILR